MRRILLILFCLLTLFCTACAGKKGPDPLADDQSASRREVDITDPGGPIPAPQLPANLTSARPSGATSDAAAENVGRGVYAYVVECSVRQSASFRETGQADGDSTDKNEPDPTEELLTRQFVEIGILHRLMDTPPQSRIGLEQRLATALQEARDILHSQGFYAGRVRGRVLGPGESSRRPGGKSAPADKALVLVTFLPGERYLLGANRIIAALPPMDGKDGQRARARLPSSLEDVGLSADSPAIAADLLAAVDKVKDSFLQNGYPFAEIDRTRYIVDHQQKKLEAELWVKPGPFCRMGELEIQGDLNVRPEYLRAMRTWRKGRPWRQDRIEAFRESLRQSGLFQSIDIAPGKEGENGERAVLVTLLPASERTVSGALKYHTDFGPGIQAAWEHRNLTGKGDSLRISAPLWMDMQEFTASYRLPFFLRRDQDFIANAGFLNQDTDAYRLTAAAASAGLQRRLARFVSATVQASVQGGNIKEPDEPSRDYLMYGLPLTLTYDSTRSPLDANRGLRVITSAAPYRGEYDGDFSIIRARVEGQAFLPLAEKDKLVLALKGVVGAAGGAKSDKIPPSVRFYSGGGGSVRGYEYQSIGPRNADRKPLGGGSLLEVSTEMRWKVTPEWGLVAFVDGGSAYTDVFDDPGQDIRWGAGLGFRYYTVVGPVRFDVATPLNPRKDDDDVQFYLSIGQSF